MSLVIHQYDRYKREGIKKIRKTNIAPPLFGAALLNRFRIYIVTKLIRDKHPPNPSFQSAKTSPARARHRTHTICLLYTSDAADE